METLLFSRPQIVSNVSSLDIQKRELNVSCCAQIASHEKYM